MLPALPAVVSTAGAVYYFQKFSVIKARFDFVVEENAKLHERLLELEEMRFSAVKKLQELETDNKYLKELCSNTEKLQKDAFASAKAALFDLGNDLSKQLLAVHKQENQQSREMSEQRITAASQKFHTEFERLVQMMSSLSQDVGNSKSIVELIKQSLLSPTGAGHLAEITLENILKASGLRSGIDFFMQHTIMDMEQNKLRPDAIVRLPGNNLLVIDAKASKFLVEIGSAEDKDSESKLLKAMNMHLKSLASKEYVDNIIDSYSLSGRDIEHVMMLMFLPTEFAVDKVTNIDPGFITKSWSANIFPVGPSGLMNMLSFARFQINDNMRSANHNAIIEEVRKILSSISVLTDYSQKIGGNIQSLVNNYDKFSASFNRNFLPKVKNIQKLGVDSNQKNKISNLTRYQLVSSKAELLDAEAIEVEEEEA